MAPQLWRTLSFASVASATTRTCTRTTVSSIYRMHPHTLPSARHHFTTPSTSSLTATSLDPPLSKPTTLGGTFRRRRYLGYFLEYMLWIILGSEALHLVWLKIDRREYAERTTFKVEVLRDVVRRLEAGDDIAADEVLKGDVKRLLLRREGAEVVDDSYFEKLLIAAETPSSPEIPKITATPPQPDAAPAQPTNALASKKPPVFL